MTVYNSKNVLENSQEFSENFKKFSLLDNPQLVILVSLWQRYRLLLNDLMLLGLKNLVNSDDGLR